MGLPNGCTFYNTYIGPLNISSSQNLPQPPALYPFDVRRWRWRRRRRPRPALLRRHVRRRSPSAASFHSRSAQPCRFQITAALRWPPASRLALSLGPRRRRRRMRKEEGIRPTAISTRWQVWKFPSCAKVRAFRLFILEDWAQINSFD